MAQPSNPEMLDKGALVDMIDQSDRKFSPQATSSAVTGGFFRGLFKGALLIGGVTALVATALVGFNVAPTSWIAAGGWSEVFTGAGLKAISIASGIAASVGAVVFGVREAAGISGMSSGYHYGQQVEKLRTAVAGQEMMEQMAAVEQQMMQEQSKAKAPEKTPITFDLPGHPAAKPPVEKICVGPHTEKLLAQQSAQTNTLNL